ncbi:cytochrome P450 [Mycena rebaudengoi]|nr:cytochrome P450 [Mycena rebaudengoi]
MLEVSTLIVTTLSMILVLLYITGAVLNRTGQPFLPGPKPHPFVGHTFQVPQTKTWKYFEQLYHRYGPIVKLSLAGDDVIILSNPADAEELLGRRSAKYSSRKLLVYAGKYQSNNHRMGLLPYGEKFKRQRAAFHQMLQPRVIGAYEAMQEKESLRMLADMISAPIQALHHCCRFAASLGFTLSYGERLNDDGKDLASITTLVDNFVRGTYPGAHLVDTFPILDRLPGFLAFWRAEAQRKHQFEVELYTRLATAVQTRMRNEDAGLECFAARLWDQQKQLNMDTEELSYLAGASFEAGTDTTAGTLQWFLMAMILFPATMRKAQAEIDTVFDANTIPVFSRMNEMPYCFALVKEVFRWAPVGPGGFPHYTDEADIYQGYTIRKGTMVIPCTWNMHHNEAEFPDSYSFDPDRFIGKSGSGGGADSLTEGHYGFGFGRRKCPGQYLAAKSVWIAIVRLLWAFDMQSGQDSSGNSIPVDPENCTSGMTSKPHEFPMTIVSRSPAHVETILIGQSNGE